MCDNAANDELVNQMAAAKIACTCLLILKLLAASTADSGC